MRRQKYLKNENKTKNGFGASLAALGRWNARVPGTKRSGTGVKLPRKIWRRKAERRWQRGNS